MEQAAAQYWMLMKRKQDIVKSKVSEFQTWEERAFAEDHAAVMWPPRSYSCTFCNREFRSAQALGGHMNVHRRDRARLKQSPPTNNVVASTSPLPPPLPRVSSGYEPLFSSSYSSWSGTGGAIKFLRVSDSTRTGHDHEDGTELDLSMVMGCKRAKLAASSPSSSSSLDLFLKPCLQAAEMHIGFKASSIEDLDLELRLGHDPPQVK